MQNLQKTGESHVKLAAPQLPADIRTGGEMVPLEFPHLYQIQAGDWRISYAVENNRLAILVLEVLNADGESSKDSPRANMTKKMKVKLLDWPEGSGNTQVPPDVLSKKLKIKWLDLADDADASQTENERTRPLIKLTGPANPPPQGSGRKTRIKLLDAAPENGPDAAEERRTTPLDQPTV